MSYFFWNMFYLRIWLVKCPLVLGRCVLDNDIRGTVRSKPVHVDCINRFEPLTSQKASSSSSSEPSGLCSGENIDNMHIDVNLVGNKVKALEGRERERRLSAATWNFSGLGSERKQKEIGELLTKNSIDVVAGQESWEREDTRIEVEGYKWFGKPHSNQNSCRGEGGVGFLVRECLVSEVEFITSVEYEQSVWMKVQGRRVRSALYVGCVYMPTDSTQWRSQGGARWAIAPPFFKNNVIRTFVIDVR